MSCCNVLVNHMTSTVQILEMTHIYCQVSLSIKMFAANKTYILPNIQHFMCDSEVLLWILLQF